MACRRSSEGATSLQQTATTTSRSSPTWRPTWPRTDPISCGWRTSSARLERARMPAGRGIDWQPDRLLHRQEWRGIGLRGSGVSDHKDGRTRERFCCGSAKTPLIQPSGRSTEARGGSVSDRWVPRMIRGRSPDQHWISDAVLSLIAALASGASNPRQASSFTIGQTETGRLRSSS